MRSRFGGGRCRSAGFFRGLRDRRGVIQKGDDLAEGLQAAQVFGLDHGGLGQAGLQSGKNFNAFDGIDPEIGVEAHIEFEHFDGVAGFFGDDFEQYGFGFACGCRRYRDCRLRNGRRGLRRRGFGRAIGKKRNDLAERLQAAQILGLDHGRFGQLCLQRGENFDALDGVDPEIGVEAHIEFEHFDGVAGFFGDHLQENFLRLLIGRWCMNWRDDGRFGCWRRGRDMGSDRRADRRWRGVAIGCLTCLRDRWGDRVYPVSHRRCGGCRGRERLRGVWELIGRPNATAEPGADSWVAAAGMEMPQALPSNCICCSIN